MQGLQDNVHRNERFTHGELLLTSLILWHTFSVTGFMNEMWHLRYLYPHTDKKKRNAVVLMLSFKKRFLRIPKFVNYILNTFVASSLVQLNSEYTLMKFHSVSFHREKKH